MAQQQVKNFMQRPGPLSTTGGHWNSAIAFAVYCSASLSASNHCWALSNACIAAAAVLLLATWCCSESAAAKRACASLRSCTSATVVLHVVGSNSHILSWITKSLLTVCTLLRVSLSMATSSLPATWRTVRCGHSARLHSSGALLHSSTKGCSQLCSRSAGLRSLTSLVSCNARIQSRCK